MNSGNNNKKSVLAILRELKVAESATFPAEKSGYVSSLCSRFGFQWDKKFKTTINRAEKTICVTRMA